MPVRPPWPVPVARGGGAAWAVAWRLERSRCVRGLRTASAVWGLGSGGTRPATRATVPGSCVAVGARVAGSRGR
eukprot:5678737-Prymnesium_polylepis.3